ncbi:iron-containing alcohol dehydrogenase [Pseudomonas sp. GX19020]|uniref:iron-containing alcohol dehydrogenase n=1 Tax=Pseudomonas sp. GX19020 TaxID=2942277 RepID=UPI002019D532|nr:iron-containing alcohol dehydrogenase [Pseudomonas sp. GX19020]MCL4068879.1 iron-containing alcohol dehydrogenase [Pseudomonas sp. GX19020]
MTGSFNVALPGRILFGRGEAAQAPALIRAFGRRVLLVHGQDPARAAWLRTALQDCTLHCVSCGSEPTLPMLEAALRGVAGFAPDVVVGLGGGAVIDMAKALAALIPAPGGAMDHLEVVGRALPLSVPPLPCVALPSTSGTGAEATKNAVIGLPEHGRKVSLRDDRMLPRLALVDPALTDQCPRNVTLASGLDALAQVIEPYVSNRATPFTDALTLPAIPRGLAALQSLMRGENKDARDEMSWVSLTGGIALANGGLGAVHGLAGVIGGVTPAAHGAICGVLLGPVLAANRARATGETAARLATVCDILGEGLGVCGDEAPRALSVWARAAGLAGLRDQGLAPASFADVARASMQSSSFRGNPVALSAADLEVILAEAG